MLLVVDPSGVARCVYAETIDLTALGQLSIRRASHVEPDAGGRWWADLAPVGGPRLGPFAPSFAQPRVIRVFIRSAGQTRLSGALVSASLDGLLPSGRATMWWLKCASTPAK